MIILPADTRDIEMQKWIHWLDAQVFTDAEGPLSGAGPVSFHGSHWFIAWNAANSNEVELPATPLGYAGWRPHCGGGLGLHWSQDYLPYNPTTLGFLYRAGVLNNARGHGIQKRLIAAREASMREHGIKTSVTYTDPLSIGSMKNMIACGYEPYSPTTADYLCESFESVGRFVHWCKTL